MLPLYPLPCLWIDSVAIWLHPAHVTCVSSSCCPPLSRPLPHHSVTLSGPHVLQSYIPTLYHPHTLFLRSMLLSFFLLAQLACTHGFVCTCVVFPPPPPALCFVVLTCGVLHLQCRMQVPGTHCFVLALFSRRICVVFALCFLAFALCLPCV